MLDRFTEVNDNEFYERVMAAETPAIVLISTRDNPQNESFIKALEKYIDLYKDKINFFFLDTSKNTSQEDLGIWAQPMILYFRDTMEFARHDYVPSDKDIEEALKRLLKL